MQQEIFFKQMTIKIFVVEFLSLSSVCSADNEEFWWGFLNAKTELGVVFFSYSSITCSSCCLTCLIFNCNTSNTSCFWSLTKPNEMTCDLCGKSFPSKARFDFHYKQTHDKTYPCPQCGQLFNRMQNVVNHQGIVRARPSPCKPTNQTNITGSLYFKNSDFTYWHRLR